MTDSTLVLYDRARLALAQARSIDEVRDVRDKAEALRLYKKQIGEGQESQNIWAEIVLRAERRAGEILAEMPRSPGRSSDDDRPSFERQIESAGIKHSAATCWQTIARIPEPAFEREIATVKAQNNELTTAGMLRLAQGKDTHQLISQSNSNEWYTPPEYIEAARSVMGAIDLDPASNEIAQEWIKATAYYTAEDNGLAHEWHGRIWLNPPWGRLTGDFVEKLAEEIAAGRVTEAVVLVNAHATDTDWFSPLWDGLLCFTDHRINYVSPDDVSSGSTHGSVFVYFGRNHECFGRHFGRWGTLVRRVRYDD